MGTCHHLANETDFAKVPQRHHGGLVSYLTTPRSRRGDPVNIHVSSRTHRGTAVERLRREISIMIHGAFTKYPRF